jgi:hypothetical protein
MHKKARLRKLDYYELGLLFSSCFNALFILWAYVTDMT